MGGNVLLVIDTSYAPLGIQISSLDTQLDCVDSVNKVV